ncbi:MAG: transcriptional regulator NrdR [Candidatus Absconditabacterales bacterium]|jgi:transcriptional repressor NrdR
MYCPACHYDDTKVIDSRVGADDFIVRRRRECAKCEFRFSTQEQIEILNLSIIKRDGSREPYSREKLEKGLRRAFEKRPINSEDFSKLVNNIEIDIQLKKKSEVTSQEIGEIVMRHLRKVDQVAYIRFASVYRDFADIETFQEEIGTLLKKKRS